MSEEQKGDAAADGEKGMPHFSHITTPPNIRVSCHIYYDKKSSFAQASHFH